MKRKRTIILLVLALFFIDIVSLSQTGGLQEVSLI